MQAFSIKTMSCLILSCCLFGGNSFADSTAEKVTAFKNSCVKSTDSSKEIKALGYKDFGEKFCTCAAKHIGVLIDNQDEMSAEEIQKGQAKATGTCIIETVLVQIVTKGNSTDQTAMTKECHRALTNIMGEDANDETQNSINEFCSCSIPKLAALQSKKDNTDAHLQEITKIADKCNPDNKPATEEE